MKEIKVVIKRNNQIEIWSVKLIDLNAIKQYASYSDIEILEIEEF